jgi:hypothetical protein
LKKQVEAGRKASFFVNPVSRKLKFYVNFARLSDMEIPRELSSLGVLA